MNQLLRIVFFLLAVAVAHPSGAQMTDFDSNSFTFKDTTEFSPEGFYVLLKTGEKKPGKKLLVKTGALLRAHITLDGTRYDLDKVEGYNSGSAFYGIYKNSFVRRFVHGKISLYILPDKTLPYYFYQVGDSGAIKQLNSTRQARTLLADCPALEAQVPHGIGEVHKIGRTNYGFMTKLFEDYNKGCTP